jgi:ribose/xylose/arabinose/galactoside ABC-type transport system permease subunit
MFDFSNLGKILVTIGILIITIGILLVLIGKIPWIGKLPGDFCWRGKNVSFYFPVTTSILISLLLTVILWLINRH